MVTFLKWKSWKHGFYSGQSCAQIKKENIITSDEGENRYLGSARDFGQLRLLLICLENERGGDSKSLKSKDVSGLTGALWKALNIVWHSWDR